MPKRIFISFGGPTYNYHCAVKRICKEAAAFELFDRIIEMTEKNLLAETDFWRTHAPHFRRYRRGFGYYLWKSFIIKRQLEQMEDNDLLLYSDAGCVLNLQGKSRMMEYFELANTSPNGIVAFQLKDHLEKTWTKMDTVIFLNAMNLLDTDQVNATAFIIRKCPESVSLINKWYDVCCNYHLIDDSPSIVQNDSSFSDHRYDQSVWSILIKQSNGIILKDETYFEPWSDGAEFPVWALRKRHG